MAPTTARSAALVAVAALLTACATPPATAPPCPLHRQGALASAGDAFGVGRGGLPSSSSQPAVGGTWATASRCRRVALRMPRPRSTRSSTSRRPRAVGRDRCNVRGIRHRAPAWTTLPPLPEPRDHFGLRRTRRKALPIGREHLLQRCDSARAVVYDPATQAWTALAPMPGARSQHGMAAVGGKLYVVGGVVRSRNARAMWAYDPVTGSSGT